MRTPSVIFFTGSKRAILTPKTHQSVCGSGDLGWGKDALLASDVVRMDGGVRALARWENATGGNIS